MVAGWSRSRERLVDSAALTLAISSLLDIPAFYVSQMLEFLKTSDVKSPEFRVYILPNLELKLSYTIRFYPSVSRM